jgi:hypothetical protein
MKTIALFLLVTITLSCSNPFDTSVEVRYEVSGTAQSVDITYENNNGGISQLTGIPLPWSITFSGDPGDYVYLAATNRGETGSITVTIHRNGKVFKRASSEGAYVTASVSGTL